ncbi:glycosyltransferase family 4 protein [Candidatus Pacearchaeota archaeon]|nr:glycosyltransferase family 4 protein [Candidatus Pacearchaeota archaeon]
MKKKLKVMILHNIISPYRNPLFEELSKKYDLTVYFCKENDAERKWSTKLNDYSFKHKILLHRNLGPFVINHTLKKELKEKDFDVYVVFENPESAFSTKKVLRYAKEQNKKFILVNGRRDDEIYSLREMKESKNPIKKSFYWFSKLTYKNYREKIYKKFDSFTSYCNATTKHLISKDISQSKIFTGIQNYPESLLLKPIWKEKPKEFKDKKIIFHIGYLNERKGVNYLIEAFNKLNRTDTILLIAGVGEDEKKLKELAKDNKNIIFLGYKDGVEKANYYSIADFFVFPTLYDVWGYVVAESFYYGKPIICTDKAEAKELIEEGKTGFIVPDKNSDALAEAMKRLLDNPKLLAEMKENVKKIPKSKIVDIKTTVKTFENAINYALEKGK